MCILNFQLPSLHTKGILTAYLILCSLFISEVAFAHNQWNREFIRISYDKADHAIIIKFTFINYQFGPFGEHAYLEWLDITYSSDGQNYFKLMRCETNDQVNNGTSFLILSEKRLGAEIKFMGCYDPPNGTTWVNSTINAIHVYTISNIGNFAVIWNIEPFIKVEDVIVSGKWYKNGLQCSDVIVGVVYEFKSTAELKPGVKTDPKQSWKNQAEKNTVDVFSEGDAVVVKGAGLGENINVYTTSGERVKSIVANRDVINIKLPSKQMYIVRVGETRYKVPL